MPFPELAPCIMSVPQAHLRSAAESARAGIPALEQALESDSKRAADLEEASGKCENGLAKLAEALAAPPPSFAVRYHDECRPLHALPSLTACPLPYPAFYLP